ncbi:MAG: nucleotidyltransferase family protein [Blautia sp.]|nr:nucleotidyltransferase family protein [Blautia sp.]
MTVPYVILKGTCAAKYYPYPECRAMGDIDIMTSHEDFRAACDCLLANGFSEHTEVDDLRRVRHREFSRGFLEVEVHSYYAHRNDPEETRFLDGLILENINPSHVLPDMVNGLTLIEHVNHHIEDGLGLRQIIDWMMFVDRCLPDEAWAEFQPLAQKSGLLKMAVIVTRMCEIYLGLQEHQWCSQADPEICARLMEYVLSCGNFGRKLHAESVISMRMLSTSGSLNGTFRLLRKRGMKNWKAAQKYSFLRPFAWLYQLGQYLVKGFGRKNSFRMLSEEYKESRKRNELFDAVGAVREQDGIVFYQDGEYRHTKR